MQNTYLYIALFFCMSIFLNGFFKFIIILFAIFYYVKHYGNKQGAILIVILFSITLIPIQKQESMNHKVLKVEEIRSSYVIASNEEGKCLLYNVDKVNLMDIIKVEGVYEKVNSQKNRETFQFEELCRRRNIKESMYVRNYEILQTSNHPRAIMYRYIDTFKKTTKKKMQSLFYHIQEEKEERLIFSSGMHLTFLSLFLSKIFHKKKETLDLFISFLYFIFFPVAVFIIRIFFFAFIHLLLRQYDKKDQLGISMIVLLLYNPSYLYEISFQLPVLFRCIYLFDYHSLPKKFKTFLVLFPYQLFVFHECYPLKVLFFSIYRILGGLCFFFALVSLCIPWLDSIFNFLFDSYLNIDSLFLQSFSFIGKPYIWWIFLWIISVLSFLHQSNKSMILSFLFLILIQFNIASLHPLGEITYLDVGQGDSILVREAMNGEVLLIDVAGKIGRNIPKERIYPYLKMEGIRKIDKVIITHDDYDHSGGIKQLKELIPIKEVIRKKQSEICLKKICFQNVVNKEYEDKNDNSFVLFTEISGLRYLFMGDASKVVESNIIQTYNKLECDVLKIGHHGSNTSSSKDFIIQMNPKLSIISSGYHNFYGHPHKEVINILNKNNSKILNTQSEGSISIFFSPFLNFVRTGTNKVSIIK